MQAPTVQEGKMGGKAWTPARRAAHAARLKKRWAELSESAKAARAERRRRTEAALSAEEKAQRSTERKRAWDALPEPAKAAWAETRRQAWANLPPGGKAARGEKISRTMRERWAALSPAEREAKKQDHWAAIALLHPEREHVYAAVISGIALGVLIPAMCPTCAQPMRPKFQLEPYTLVGWQCYGCKAVVPL
jgi:hypothetical protein